VKGSIDRFVDSTLRRESKDERLKRLIGEVPEETHPRFGAQPESPDDIAMFPTAGAERFFVVAGHVRPR
jgi:hypothetical protein